jgi:hypothetical protein
MALRHGASGDADILRQTEGTAITYQYTVLEQSGPEGPGIAHSYQEKISP